MGCCAGEKDRGAPRRLDEPWGQGKEEMKGSGAGVTGEGVDEQADEHGEHGDGDPVGEALVAHAAVDGHAGLVALQGHRGAALGLYAGTTPSAFPPTHRCPVPLSCVPKGLRPAPQPPLVTATGTLPWNHPHPPTKDGVPVVRDAAGGCQRCPSSWGQ